MKKHDPKGPQAAKLRQRKFELLRALRPPQEGLPGSLTLSQVRCGKPTCRCAKGEGHPNGVLTFMAGGQKRTLHIPRDCVEQVQRRVQEARQFKERSAELLAINAQLFALWCRQRRQ